MRATKSARTGIKAAVAAAGAVGLLSTGVAFAASGGHAPWAHAGAASTHAVDPTHPTHPAHPTSSGEPTDLPSDSGSPSTGPDAHAFPGLCRAYLSGNKAEHGKALASPAFTALVSAAGGVDGVATYCGALTTGPSATHPTKPTQAASPTHPAHPTHPGKPTQAASPTHPARPTHPGKPTQAASPTRTTNPHAGTHGGH